MTGGRSRKVASKNKCARSAHFRHAGHSHAGATSAGSGANSNKRNVKPLVSGLYAGFRIRNDLDLCVHFPIVMHAGLSSLPLERCSLRRRVVFPRFSTSLVFDAFLDLYDSLSIQDEGPFVPLDAIRFYSIS